MPTDAESKPLVASCVDAEAGVQEWLCSGNVAAVRAPAASGVSLCPGPLLTAGSQHGEG